MYGGIKMKETVRDVVGGFMSGVKTGVSKSPSMKFEVDLSTKTNKKVDEIIDNVGLLQQKTVDDVQTILKVFTEELKISGIQLGQQLSHTVDEVSKKVDYRWKITQWLLGVGMVGNALILLISL